MRWFNAPLRISGKEHGPLIADVTMHDPGGEEYVMRVGVTDPSEIPPLAERVAEDVHGLDLGATDWRAL